MNEQHPGFPHFSTWRSSLAIQLTWVSILLVVFSLIAMGAGLIIIARLEQRNNAFQLQEKNADRVALLIAAYVNRAKDDLVLFEKIEPLARLPLAGQKASLEKLLLHRQSWYSQFTLLDTQGRERIRISRFYTFLPGELRRQSQSPALITALKGSIYLSPVFISPDSGLLSVEIALPVRTVTAEIAGVLTAEVNISRLWQEVSQIKIGQSGYAYLVDVNGRFVAFQEPAEVLNRYGEDMSRMPPVSEFMSHKSEGALRGYKYIGLKKEWVIGVYAPIQGTTWAVIVEWPTREAYAAVVRMQWTLGGFILLGVMVAGGLAYGVSRRLIRPIRALTAAAQRIGSGDLETEIIKIHRQDEVGILAQAFQQMQNELKVLYKDLERQVRELQEMQKALRESEEHYRNIFENAVEGIFQSTPDGMYLSVNPALSLMFGYESPQAMIQEVRDIGKQLYVNPEEREKFISILNRKGMVEAFEAEMFQREGDKFWISMNVRVIRDEKGDIRYFEGTVEDITERKKAEEALRAAHQRLFDIIEFLPDATFVIDHNKKVVTWNRACEEMTGVDKTEIIGQGDYAYSLPFYGQKRPMLIDYCTGNSEGLDGESQSIRKNNNLVYHEFFTPILNQGQGAYLASVASPLFDRQGQVMGAIQSIREITELKRLESQVLQAKKMESIGTLAGGIAHDFNNLLMSIQGNASLMLVNLDPVHPHYELLKEIEKQVTSGSDLTHQLLGFARGGQYEIKATDLNEVIERTSNTFGRTRKGIVIHKQFGKDLWATEVDRGQIEQVLLNLYINAWEAMPKGGDLEIITGNLKVEKDDPLGQDLLPGSYVAVSLKDTGIGMDEETRERVFDPFFTTKEMGRGTGLGLASTYGIIKAHQGFIYVDSKLGQGTTFRIYLPASAKKVEKSVQGISKMTGGRETILLVDDEKDVVKVTTAMLEALGYTVLVGNNGREAIALYREQQEDIALVILDMIMPEMSGEAVFEVLKSINPEVKVLLSTGYSLQDVAQEVFTAGCQGFIQKPFTLHSLSQKVREVLDPREGH